MESKEVKVSVGGWYQRTTLHLSELQAFFTNADTKLSLSKSKLKQLHKNLELKSVNRITGHFEYIKAITKTGLEIRYYEDGLYTIHLVTKDIEKANKGLRDYLNKKLLPSINYLFSLGVPTPKVLANIKETHATVVELIDKNPSTYEIDQRKFGKIYSKISSQNITVYKTSWYIFIVGSSSQKPALTPIMENEIFFREFKDQLERYLDIHRSVWEEIAEIKEKKIIKGNQITQYRSKLEAYKQTINLITHRISQMRPYARTRSSISKTIKIEDKLMNLFQYRFEDLFSTLDYIKELWGVTRDYVSSAINVVKDLENKALGTGIRSIQILASVGVIGGFLGYFTRSELPTLSKIGIGYFVGLAILATGINYAIKKVYANKKYEIKFIERSKKL